MADPNDPLPPIRVLTFATRPDVLLITVREGADFYLPRLRSPFDRHTVARALLDREIPAYVSEASATGRYDKPLTKDEHDAKATRAQQAREAEAARAVEIRHSPNATTTELQRAELILDKQRIDCELRDLKAEIGRAKALAATRGTFLPVETFRRKERQIVELQTKSLAVQHRLGELKKQFKKENIEKANAKRQTALERFRDCARELLPEQTYLAIWAMTEDMTP